ncbi:MAG: hypothetical protein KBG28_31245 [Kofleriaceae bacterium]|nr:hypothetical protein [Kofleriaceae bacterium]
MKKPASMRVPLCPISSSRLSAVAGGEGKKAPPPPPPPPPRIPLGDIDGESDDMDHDGWVVF